MYILCLNTIFNLIKDLLPHKKNLFFIVEEIIQPFPVILRKVHYG